MRMIEFRRFSPKQLRVLNWWCKNSRDAGRDAIICDGAVRSGKTLCMSISFVCWAFYRFDNQSFAICGRSVGSVRRNVTTALLQVLAGMGFACTEKLTQKYIEIRFQGRCNRFYLFSGKDESSAALIQGITLAGVLFDEVALMPRSFVEQALARCSVEGSKFWFNCNPEHPYHWFYREWIQKAKTKNALYLHFTMRDNPSLTESMIRRYRTLYAGAFYDRFILGRWVASTGLIYPMFSPEKHLAKSLPAGCERYLISCDYGIVNPASFGLWGLSGGRWYRLDEYYYDSRVRGGCRTDEEYYASLQELAGGYPIEAVIVDPSASSFIECVRRHARFQVRPAVNDVLTGIGLVSAALQNGELLFSERCRDTIREFSLYRWEENRQKDCPRKENDHAMDDIRYFAMYALHRPQNAGFCALSSERGRPDGG